MSMAVRRKARCHGRACAARPWRCAWTAAVLLFFLLIGHSHGAGQEQAASATVSGTVLNQKSEPVSGCTVRLQGSTNETVTDENGRFVLAGLSIGSVANVSAWKDGYYCALVKEIQAPRDGIVVTLLPCQNTDNAAYAWIPPTSPDPKGSCAECHHPALVAMSVADAHLKSATNPRFLTMYSGTDMDGNQGTPTRYAPGAGTYKFARFPQRPDPGTPYHGPGYILDFPETPGTCCACHIPGVSIAEDRDPASATGVDRFGIHCDFCHKVADVRLNPATGLPFPRDPGVHSMKLRRPFTDDPQRPQLFFGTFDDDNIPTEDTKLPLLAESRFCAPCHYGVFWSTVIYNSYGEWLESPYANPNSGKARTCQECHMVSPAEWKGTILNNVAPGNGGLERNPSALHSHFTTVDETLLRNALSMTVATGKKDKIIEVRVQLVNDKTGHHVPSDCPLRHLILHVEATDASGTPLRQVSGPVLPDWCGTGDPAKGYLAYLPGKTYVKLLAERWTGVYPATAYWRHTDLVSDNRLAAFQADTSTYTFTAPPSGETRISVNLLYRRAFIALRDQKKWDSPDVVMAQERLVIPAQP